MTILSYTSNAIKIIMSITLGVIVGSINHPDGDISITSKGYVHAQNAAETRTGMDLDEERQNLMYMKNNLYAEKYTKLKQQQIYNKIASRSSKQQSSRSGGISSSEKRTLKASIQDIDLLARIIHAEASNQPLTGKVAIGEVILNRVSSNKFPNTIREVIYAPKQFQPVINGSIKNKPDPIDIEAAKYVLAHKTNITKGALYFYSPRLASRSNSNWFERRLRHTTTIGAHKFFKYK